MKKYHRVAINCDTVEAKHSTTMYGQRYDPCLQIEMRIEEKHLFVAAALMLDCMSHDTIRKLLAEVEFPGFVEEA